MKKYLTFAGLVLLMVSCSREPLPAGEDFTLEAEMPAGELSRTVLGMKAGGVYPVLWGSGDYITAGGVASKALRAVEAGASTATFRFSSSISAPYNVLYGAVEGTDDTFEIPAVQAFSDGNIGNGCAPMYAVTSAVSFTMHHLSCVLYLPLSGSAVLAGVSLSSLDGTPLSGRFRMEKSGRVFSGTVSSVQPRSEVQLTFPSGGADLSSGVTLCMAVRPGMFEKGLRLEIYATDGSMMVLTALVGQTLEAGKVYELPPAVFAPNVAPVTPIASYQELKDFALRVAEGEKYLHARLIRDIAVDASWTPLEGFTGDFDGGGYCISGLKKAFANELRGCMRNLTVEGDIAVSSQEDIVGDASIYWAGILCNRIYTGGRVTDCVVRGAIRYTQWGKTLVVGGLCGYAPRGTVSGCVNKASVTAVGDGSNAIYAGGLFGRIYASSETIDIVSSRNEGTVTVSGSIKGGSIGGIVGHMDAVHTSTLSRNSNSGAIVVEASSVSGVMHAGGIAGYSLDAIEDCASAGTIRQSASTASIQNVGGICGCAITDRVSGCSFSGSILLDGASANVVRCGGILGFVSGDSAVDSIALSDCSFSGSVTLDIPSHSTLYAMPITGLYSIMYHTETDCVSTGTITVR